MARLDQFEKGFKTTMFLSVVGEDGLQIYVGMDVSPETDREMLNKVVKNSKNSASAKQTKRTRGLFLIDKIRRRMKALINT